MSKSIEGKNSHSTSSSRGTNTASGSRPLRLISPRLRYHALSAGTSGIASINAITFFKTEVALQISDELLIGSEHSEHFKCRLEEFVVLDGLELEESDNDPEHFIID
jgi:hypothetical protein